ncbi:carboxylesterase family protein [Peristeroidobacter agariperforans]|uniref:carboxylesterase family protein n=1 Tax=Peristeroidobacter agariperforans TaxID=268404 RepID=UPI00101C86CB|nr:carboxylesterase family protein [Peristeroidobacter agariperforans]
MTSPSFDAPAGRIIGWRDGRVIRATGIRYARASRFQPPTPEPASPTSIEATGWAPACAQADHPFGMGLMKSSLRTLATTEDCLRLSVTRPDNIAPGDQRPVMVWIHGGSYVFGAGDAAIYDARALVEEQSVIVVSITYRLGLLGFLGGSGGRAANVGLLDIIEALRWVKANIAAFGGDADNITLFGQSAGGDAIAHLMIADGAKDLFRRAIIQSAPLGISLGRRKMYAAMMKIAGHVAHDAPTDDVIAAQASVVAASEGFGWPASMPFGTQYGHHPLPAEEDVDSAWSRCARHVDVLIGSTAEEGSFFIPIIEPLRKLAALPLLGNTIRRTAISTITRKVYATAADRFAKRHARAGGRAYTYKIHWGSKTNRLGATHAIDLPLLFGEEKTWHDADLVAGLSWPEVHATAQKVRALWSLFARTGSLDAGVIDPALVSFRKA